MVVSIMLVHRKNICSVTIMYFNFHGLPPEIKEFIFCYCTVKDLKSLARCSREFYNSLEYIIWRVVRIPWDILEEKGLPEKVENLRFTNCLTLFEREIAEERSKDSDDINCDAWFNKSVNFSKILNSCDLNRLTKLNLIGVATNPEIQSTVAVLKKIKELSLIGTGFLFDTDWKYLKTLQYLKRLKLCKCGIEDEGVEHIVHCQDLVDLHLELCYLMRDEGLLHICSAINLRKLTLIQNSHISANAFKCFRYLKELVYLHLEATNIDDTNLVYLCEYLQALQVLNVGSKIVTDAGFAKISSLNSLLELNIDTCSNVTDSCFDFIKDLPKLKKISFNSTNLTDKVFTNLLQLKTLQEVNIINLSFSFSEDIVDNFCKQLGLKKRIVSGNWKVNFITLAKDYSVTLINQGKMGILCNLCK